MLLWKRGHLTRIPLLDKELQVTNDTERGTNGCSQRLAPKFKLVSPKIIYTKQQKWI